MKASGTESDPSRARQVFSLNGVWDFQPGGAEVPTTGWKQRIRVPGLVDLATPQCDWRQYQYHWYRKTFRVNAASTPENAMLVLEQSMFGTEVWMNGSRRGGDIACYTSQEYDVNEVLMSGMENELLVRVGAKETLPPESAVGKDQERTEFIPGIWGDVCLILSGNPRIARVQVIPHLESKSCEARVTVTNHSNHDLTVELRCKVLERRSGLVASPMCSTTGVVHPMQEAEMVVSLPLRDLHEWSPDDPFLYQVESTVSLAGIPRDRVCTTFGMREFRVSGSDFHLNGKRIFLKGGNIAFHRFLSDADRGNLPWNLDWAKKLLIDIPKAHNFNFFRSHIGQMYNRWYDIADEHGMLLQDEWMFWTTTGTKEQIGKEFTRWLQDNWNHPSIIIWDALNECSDDIVQNEIVPAMKRLDPTRPWESVDFVEQHPYIYSLGPVLPDRRLGFTMGLADLEGMPTPSVANEFLWWWLDSEWKPTVLMHGVIERWLGRDYTIEEVIDRQSFLAQELVELFRRMRLDAIQPFVYLSNNAGPTANWFSGRIANLEPKPLLKTLKNAFSPFGLSIELWDRHFLPGESRSVRIFIFNDHPVVRIGTVRYGVKSPDGRWLNNSLLSVTVDASGYCVCPLRMMFPAQQGEYRIRAELFGEDSGDIVAYSEKIGHVLDPPGDSIGLRQVNTLVLEESGEIAGFLKGRGIPVQRFSGDMLRAYRVVVVGHGMAKSGMFKESVRDVTGFVEDGGTLVLIEPEYDIQTKETVPVLDGLSLTIERRVDADKGGYDSYIFAENPHHPLWAGIEKKHLQMFNGGFGGEVVSQHDVTCSGESRVHARCGLKLGIDAVFEAGVGKGRVIVSRLQLRGRLMTRGSPDSLYERRTDPVLQRYLLNLISYASEDRDSD